ncbi:tyrosine-type recombinase/integrase [uncultured Bartonella sp.]|uniref:tyrosine-type recombinase/integrase n=1 Tax=uncultured Bartonella sp. TaxID=104108 RepID=UPI0025E5F997|nr:tyrosine-type recombinase/integrase [uncultured Bartonella sp.]
MRVGLKYLKIYKDRHGILRCYHRKAGISIDLKKYPLNSPEFLAQYVRINNELDRASKARAGTLGKIVLEYKQHPAFTDLSAKTKSDYERYFRYLSPIFDTPIQQFSTPLVVKIRDKIAQQHGRRSGNYVKTVLSVVFSWAKERGYCVTNPASEIKSLKAPKDAPQANRPWSDRERENVLAALPKHMRLPIVLMMFCGLDPQDALRLPKTAIADGKIDVRRGKTGVAVWMPLPQPVKDEIEVERIAQSDSVTVCLNSQGKPWTVSGFRASWRPIRKRLEAEGAVEKGLTLKGLRHTVATILAEMGMDERTIADVLGQKTIEMARHYSRRADKSRKMENVVKIFDKEVNRRKTKNVYPS